MNIYGRCYRNDWSRDLCQQGYSWHRNLSFCHEPGSGFEGTSANSELSGLGHQTDSYSFCHCKYFSFSPLADGLVCAKAAMTSSVVMASMVRSGIVSSVEKGNGTWWKLIQNRMQTSMNAKGQLQIQVLKVDYFPYADFYECRRQTSNPDSNGWLFPLSDVRKNCKGLYSNLLNTVTDLMHYNKEQKGQHKHKLYVSLYSKVP